MDGPEGRSQPRYERPDTRRTVSRKGRRRCGVSRQLWGLAGERKGVVGEGWVRPHLPRDGYNYSTPLFDESSSPGNTAGFSSQAPPHDAPAPPGDALTSSRPLGVVRSTVTLATPRRMNCAQR